MTLCKLYGQWIASGHCDGQMIIARAGTREQAYRAWIDKVREKLNK